MPNHIRIVRADQLAKEVNILVNFMHCKVLGVAPIADNKFRVEADCPNPEDVKDTTVEGDSAASGAAGADTSKGS